MLSAHVSARLYHTMSDLVSAVMYSQLSPSGDRAIALRYLCTNTGLAEWHSQCASMSLHA